MTRSICDGLQVVEMGAGSIAASMAGMLLADYGARVVKVEPPEGDRLRHQHPSGFLVWNRGKESVIADLRTDDGRQQAASVAAQADLIIEGFAAGVAERWGLGYDQLRRTNERLVVCSVKGFGSTGRYAGLQAYEGVVAAKAGVYTMGAFGYRPGPIYFSAPLASTGAAHMAVSGSLAALIAREQTGRGQRVEATLLQGLNPLDYFGTMHWQYAQRPQPGATTASAGVGASRYSFFVPTQDGRWVIFTQMLPHQAHALSRAVGIDDTLDDPRFAQQPQFATAEDAQEWEDRLWDAMATKPYEHWEKVFLDDPNIAFELARFSEEGLDHQQIRHNGESVRLEHPTLGPIDQIGPLARFRDTPATIRLPAPEVGQNAGGFGASTRPPSPPGSDALEHPLSGVTIVELGYFYAMPYGVTMAAALGARVIKIEGATGDPMRSSFGPPETGAAKTMEGKESIALDLQTPEGRAIVQKIVAKADVFVNGFRSGVAERMGLDYATLSALNPRLLYVHAAGYGVDGPLAHRPIYAQVAQAIAGSIGRYAGRWLDPEFTKTLSTMEAQVVVLPRLRGPVDGDANAALGVFSSILFGLFDQRRTGQGQFLSTTMIGGNAWAYADDFLRYKGKPALPTVDEDNLGLHALYRLYNTGNGWVFLASPRQVEWEALVSALDRPELAADPRFATNDDRRANDTDLAAVLSEILRTRTAAEWEARLAPSGIACVEAFQGSASEFTCTDPVLRETGLTVEVEHPLFGTIVRHGVTVQFSETPGRADAGCLIGQHTEQILGEIGYSSPEIADLKDKQVVSASPAAG